MTSTTGYILGESEQETRRLLAQAAGEPAIERAIQAGLAPGMHVVDAGCGPGVFARGFARVVGRSGSVVGLDLSRERLNAARAVPPEPDAAPIRYMEADVHSPPVPEGSVDFVFSQYVLEYFRDADRVVETLARLLRPGGKLLVSDVDNIGLLHWPVTEELEQGMAAFRQVLAATGFDPQVGRKLYRWVVDAGLKNVKADIRPYYLVAGEAPPEQIEAWTQRFDALAPIGDQAFGGEAAYRSFVDGFIRMLQDPSTFSYAVTVTIEGTR